MTTAAKGDLHVGSDEARRAVPMRADERRTAIATATLPLLFKHGTSVTTRQIADAANVAEGTIFRVFPDKEAVIQAAIDLAFNPLPTEQALAKIDRALPTQQQLTIAVATIQRRMGDLSRLISTVGSATAFSRERLMPQSPQLVSMLDSVKDQLRYSPERAARLLQALTLSASHPALFGSRPMPASEIVALLLDGIRVQTSSGRKGVSRC